VCFPCLLIKIPNTKIILFVEQATEFNTPMLDKYTLRCRLTDLYRDVSCSAWFAVGLILAVMACLVSVFLVTAESHLSSAGLSKYWPRNTIDDYAHVSLNAKRAALKKEPCIMLVGTAAMREGLLAPEQLQKQVSENKPHQLCVVNLMAGGQSALEATALVDEALSDQGNIIVMGVSPSRMSADVGELQKLVKHPRLAFTNDAFFDEAKRLGLDLPSVTDTHLITSFDFYGLRLFSFWLNYLSGTHHTNNVHTYDGRPQQDQVARESDYRRLASRLGNYDDRIGVNMSSYRRIMARTRLRSNNTKFVLLDIPLNPDAVTNAIGKSRYERHIEFMTSFCADMGCAYVNPNAHQWIPSEYFHDWSHMSRPEGRAQYSAPVVKLIRELTRHWSKT